MSISAKEWAKLNLKPGFKNAQAAILAAGSDQEKLNGALEQVNLVLAQSKLEQFTDLVSFYSFCIMVEAEAAGGS